MLGGSAVYKSTLNFNIAAALALHVRAESPHTLGTGLSPTAPGAPGAQSPAGEGGQAPQLFQFTDLLPALFCTQAQTGLRLCLRGPSLHGWP